MSFDLEDIDEVRAKLAETREDIAAIARNLVDALLYVDDKDWARIALWAFSLDQRLQLEKLLRRHLKVELAG